MPTFVANCGHIIYININDGVKFVPGRTPIPPSAMLASDMMKNQYGSRIDAASSWTDLAMTQTDGEPQRTSRTKTYCMLLAQQPLLTPTGLFMSDHLGLHIFSFFQEEKMEFAYSQTKSDNGTRDVGRFSSRQERPQFRQSHFHLLAGVE